MSNADWGTKRICPNCGARFYDLKRRPIVCPKCNAQIRPSEDGRRPMRGKKAAFIPTPKAAPIAAVDPVLEDLDAEDIELEEVVDEIEADDDELIEDASDLGEDGDDMTEVMEHLESEAPHDP